MSRTCISIFFICCLSSFKSGDTVDIVSVRLLFQRSAPDEAACKQMIGLLGPYDEKNPLFLGYKGCATMMMAKHVFSPFSKMSYFKKGKQMLESAINSDNKNYELRFLRFIAQTNMPSFLGYNNDIEKDKEYILNYYSHIKDAELKEFVLPSLKKSKYLTTNEKDQLR